ncbi:hypothetical protein KP509_39G002800 [Ceratopteris richardii]|uniref:Vacuolar protein sorting-associated protein 41 homolog n=1 Tax=Ceratopteris richardii TaxID=49495 RepID=A0A8T2PY83_CERRI|nr:hypothetical protein KP509_39G002800 [Ceratopteris richardii]
MESPTQPIVPADGVEGDDEYDEDEEDAQSEIEDGGGETSSDEEEPRLKYQRMAGSMPSLLSNDTASCITVSERMIALGTHDGTVHLLDYQGNQVKEFAAHTATVNELSFDMIGEFIGSCSDDGSVVINSLYSDEKERFDFHRPMKAVALDPDYEQRSTRRFVAGGLAGQLMLYGKSWFGRREQILHSQEGPIHAIKWRTSLIAWANDVGVKIYDTASNQRLTYIKRPQDSPRAELIRPHLVWQDDTYLVIGWGNSVNVAAIRTHDSDKSVPNKSQAHSGSKYVEIVANFQTEYHISGISPYEDALVVLAYLPVNETKLPETQDGIPSKQVHAQRPEVRIISWQNEERTRDALPIHGYEHYKAKDYALAHAPFSGSSSAGGQWTDGDEPLYFIVSPKDVVIARPRDADDHINWLLEHGLHEQALIAVQTGKARRELVDEVGSKYLDHLLLERQYARAAALCPKLLRGSAAAWERWVFHFAHLRELPVLAPYIPTSDPQLRDTAYEVVLNALITNPAFHKQALSIIKTWPSSIYSVAAITTAIELQLSTSIKSPPLQEALAELYLINNQYEKALAIFVELMLPTVFDFIEEHNLYDSLHDKVLPLLQLDAKRGVALLVQHLSTIPPVEVVSQLQRSRADGKYRHLLHLYLHELFEKDPNAGKDFHGLQVELYADYEPRLLLPFLRSSHYYSLDKAYEVCTQRLLTRERVFILGRMGNSREALSLIIRELKDMGEAVEFVAAQHDDDLWEELINQSLSNPRMIGALLEVTVGNIDPLHVVSRVPNGMEIPRLRDRLVKIVTDYRTETSLRHGCNNILKTDCVNLSVRYLLEARHAIFVGSRGGKGSKRVESKGQDKLTSLGDRTNLVSGGSGKCCICFDPVALQNVSVVAFFCAHVYHVTCLAESSDSIHLDSSRGQQNNLLPNGIGAHSFEMYQENGDTQTLENDRLSMRCILCTTAAATSRKKY